VIAYAALVVVAQPGVDHGLTGQVAMRATLGYWGSRLLSSPYRVVAATYWFAAQALAGALGIQALVEAMPGHHHLPLVPVALALAVFHATMAVLGFDVMRWLLRAVLPVSLAFTAVLIGFYVTSGDPSFGVGHVFSSPHQHLTWTGFATYVTVMAGASLTLVGSIADFCRYTPTRRDMRIGLFASAITATMVTTFVGGYAAVATGETNPFVAVSKLTSSTAVLVALAGAIVVQGIAANITNVYTAGLSLVNTAPSLGRVRSTLLVGIAAVTLSAFPDFVDHAQNWITHLGNLAAPLTGVVLADYVVRRRCRVDVEALFDPGGRYRFWNGVNVEAILAVAGGVAVYYALPHSWLKVAWGVGAGAAIYLVLVAVVGTFSRQPSPEPIAE
jgi:cytosine/uracil/thiamine/allantoin permease